MSKNHISTKKLAYIVLDLTYKTDEAAHNEEALKINTLLVDSGFEILVASCDNTITTKYVYKAVALINKETKEIHIASAGTKLNIYDILDDILIALHHPPTKLSPLKNFVEDIIEKLAGYEKVLEYIFNTYGHSLGLAVAYITGVDILSHGLHFNKSITFDSPGSKPIVKEAIKKNLFTSKVTTTIEELTNYSKVLNAAPNIVNITNQHLGKTKLVLHSKKSETSKSENLGTYLYNFAKQKIGYSGIKGVVDSLVEIISSVSRHGLVNFNITLTVDDWNTEIPKYANNTLNLKITLSETVANYWNCNQEEVTITGDIL
ncbi:MAG: hypothetical protein RCO49_07530 [Rickettsia endosymbiont of Argas persicus]